MFRIMPLYRVINRNRYRIQPMDVALQIPIGKTVYQGRLFKQEYEGITTFYIHCPEYLIAMGFMETRIKSIVITSNVFFSFRKQLLL